MEERVAGTHWPFSLLSDAAFQHPKTAGHGRLLLTATSLPVSILCLEGLPLP